MAATPTKVPLLDPREQPILENLLQLQNELNALKQDRSVYVKSSDVLPLYERVVKQIELRNAIRAERPEIASSANDNEKIHAQEGNQVDRVLGACFQLISLFFMTVGRNNEAPAAYALTSTIKRLLYHFTQVDLYSSADLAHITQTLENIRNIVKNSTTYSSKLLDLLTDRVNDCQSSLDNLISRLKRLDPDLQKIHEKLISILRSISAANTKSKESDDGPFLTEQLLLQQAAEGNDTFPSTEVKKLQDQLKELDGQRVDGKFVNAGGEIPEGNTEVCELLEKCLKWSEMVLERKGEIPEAFLPKYEALVGIRNALEKLTITKGWSLREADLYDYQRQLDIYDEDRIDENFVDEDGNFADLYVQRTLLYLIRRSYGYIYYLMISSEAVSEALLPVFKQLETLKRCLLEVQAQGGVSSLRELYPYSMKLNSLDSQRVDGKFMVGDEVPEGQARLVELISECYEIQDELKDAVDVDDD